MPVMSTSLPSAEDVRALLQPLDTGRMRLLAERSGVPFTTLWKVRSGETKNPGVDTVRMFMPHIDGARAEPAPAAAAEQGT